MKPEAKEKREELGLRMWEALSTKLPLVIISLMTE
jgi:hypothetical protein